MLPESMAAVSFVKFLRLIVFHFGYLNKEIYAIHYPEKKLIVKLIQGW